MTPPPMAGYRRTTELDARFTVQQAEMAEELAQVQAAGGAVILNHTPVGLSIGAFAEHSWQQFASKEVYREDTFQALA